MKLLQNKTFKKLFTIINISILLINIAFVIIVFTHIEPENILLILLTKSKYITTEYFVVNENYLQVKTILEKDEIKYSEKNGTIFVAFDDNEYQFMFYKGKLQAIYLQNYNGLERIFPKYYD